MNITGVVARRKGLNVRLIGIEGDKDHVSFAHEALTANGFNASQYTIYHGIASAKSGWALFPVQEYSSEVWGAEPLFDVNADDTAKLLGTGKYQPLEQIPLQHVMPENCSRIDLLHVDIQGGEVNLVKGSLDFLNASVAMMLIGTHSRQIEGELFDILLKAGWVLEVERPAILSVGSKVYTRVDGVQLWRNPRLISDKKSSEVESHGFVCVLNAPSTIRAQDAFKITVKLSNESNSEWLSENVSPVYLSYHWRDEEGNDVIFDGVRTGLTNGRLKPKSSVIQEMEIHAPDCKKNLQLVVTVVQEGVRWFAAPDFTAAIAQIEIV